MLDVAFILSIIAILLTILNTIFGIGKSHDKMFLYLSSIIALIWSIYGYFDNKPYILIGYLIILLIICYIIFQQ